MAVPTIELTGNRTPPSQYNGGYKQIPTGGDTGAAVKAQSGTGNEWRSSSTFPFESAGTNGGGATPPAQAKATETK